MLRFSGGGGVNCEFVFLLDAEGRVVGVLDLPHHRMELVVRDIKGQVMIDGKALVLIQVGTAAKQNRVRLGAATTGDHILHSVTPKALVVMDVPVENDHLGMKVGEPGFEKVAQ